MTGTWQPAALDFVDAEQWTSDYLSGLTSTVPDFDGHTGPAYVGTEHPDKRWDLMVVVRRDGGAVVGLDDFPRLAIRTWANTEDAATGLARWVTTQLLGAPGVGPCKRVRHISGPIRVPDPRLRQRLSLFELQLRGQAL